MLGIFRRVVTENVVLEMLGQHKLVLAMVTHKQSVLQLVVLVLLGLVLVALVTYI